MKSYRPKRNEAILEPLPVLEKTATGIFLPQGQAGDYVMNYKVVRMGANPLSKKGNEIPQDFGVGDLVISPLNFSHTTLDNGHKIVAFDQIIAKFETEMLDL